ncbi:hypothetical protein P879_05895 [Paragonimus westermani]|uniref:Endonuclease/exonuclease/phosphatase domain-containing protein n=1 Tax=Paragonimus westermani TaxID=34504 RepID=A0A8T0DPJ3_9TREM|nr:hypothetical protein P879_05895 [Paragonimus westermani]
MKPQLSLSLFQPLQLITWTSNSPCLLQKRRDSDSGDGDLTPTILSQQFSNSTEHPISVSTTELHPSGQPFPREAQLTSRSSVNCLYTNTQGLLSKLAEFRDTMTSGTFSLVGLTETWLIDEITDAEIAISGFSVLRSDRGSQGGGVALYYSTQLKLTVTNDPPFHSRETLWRMLPLDATGLCLVAVIHRPPTNSPEADTLLLSDLNQFLARGHTHVLPMGDFNCPQLHTRVHSSGSFQAELIALCDLIPLHNHVLQPTRFRSNDTPLILDLLLTNEELMIEDVHYLPPPGASDHVCLQFEFVCYAFRVADASIFTHRHVNFSLLRNLLLANTLSNCAFADSDTVWREFAFFFQTLISIATITTNLPVASIRQFRLRSRTRKWICRRNLAWLAYAYAHSPDTWETFRSLRNHCVTLIHMNKQEYQSSLARRFAANPKYLYKHINSMRRVKPGITTPNTPTGTVTTLTQAADVLRAQYVSVFTSASKHTPLILTIYFGPSLTDIEFTSSNVISKLLHLKVNTSTGKDGFRPRVLKGRANELSLPLSMLFGHLFSNSTVPAAWKSGTFCSGMEPLTHSGPATDGGCSTLGYENDTRNVDKTIPNTAVRTWSFFTQVYKDTR